MGTLTPGAKLIYERVDDAVYSREVGSTERNLVGYAYKRDPLDYRNYQSCPEESQFWHDIRIEARTNPTLQKALDQCKIIYHLSKSGKKPPDWHPV